MQIFLQHLLNGLSVGSIYALIALGYTLVYGILRLINFAHGDVFMVAAYAALFAVMKVGGGLPLALAASMGTACGVGFLIEKLAYRPLRGQPRINLLITAVGVSLLLENLAQVAFGADPQVVPKLMEDRAVFEWGELRLSSIDLTVFVVSVALMLSLEWLVHRTRLGRAMRAVSHSHETAALVGVSVDRVISFTFVVGSGLAAGAAVLYGIKYPQAEPLMGVNPGLKAFVAAVLGGIGNLRGAVLGALLMGVAEALVVAYGASTWRDALAFAILILILVLKPAGLLGRHEAEKV